ncbi:MAG: hypothetical protein K2Y56_04645 [Methylobacterium sp.]|uniref:hypothetical protein n=1 Tax=Methylobacterium sp. TaxID=409 RepID=UPI0025F70D6A|nr:hypothetical protein [Methylobacterium sp.]MBX9930815.1 hypothetical protein [Methylobacterium sp.]
MSAAEVAAFTALTDEDVAVVAYVEAAEGDIETALRFAVEDLLMAERRIALAAKLVSLGYVRGRLPDSRT